MIIEITIGSIVVVLVGIYVVKTQHFKPVISKVGVETTSDVDANHAIESLQAMVQFKTISYADKSLEDAKAFAAFKAYLLSRYSTIASQATVENVGDTGILFKIKGDRSDQAIVLMSHYDVVPENGKWDYDPFGGEIIEGRLYGRGTLDTKVTLCAVMEAMEQRLKDELPLKADYYLAFSGDEETTGPSAPAIVEYLKSRDIKPTLVLDEGGAIIKDAFPGVDKPVALIGTAEKGYVNASITVTTPGGHAAMPPKNTSVTNLVKNIDRLHKSPPFSLQKEPLSMMMFDRVMRHASSWFMRSVFANMWLTYPFVKRIIKRHPEVVSLFQTTQAFTMLKGSDAMNVLPNEATAGINYRILPSTSIEDVKHAIQKRLSKEATLTINKAAEATTLSKTQGSFYDIETIIKKTWGDVVTTPYLMMAGTDARYHHEISEHVYRFSPLTLSKADRNLIHSVNESIALDNIVQCVRFYKNLLDHLND